MYITTPPMGWNSWNTFGTDISEQLIMEIADVIVDKGLDKLGYNYVVIDDCWSLKERDENGRLVADPEKFPHGMKYLSDYVHSKGLKFGMYSCCGTITCAGYPASYNSEYIDAETFAEWGVDFLKYDNCYPNYECPIDIRYKRMGLALSHTGRDILYSACSWGVEDTKKWIKQVGAHMWRSTYDIHDSYESLSELMIKEIKSMEYNGNGCYNDLDMLIVGMNGNGNVGMGGCTYEEYKLHFAFWCFFGSPLMIGGDIRSMSDEYLKLLSNKDLLRINQDKAYCQPFIIDKREKAEEPSPYFYKSYPEKDIVKIAKYLDDGKIAIGVFNLSEAPTSPTMIFLYPEFFGLPTGCGKYLSARNIFTGEVSDTKVSPLLADALAPHSCVVYIAEVKNR